MYCGKFGTCICNVYNEIGGMISWPEHIDISNVNSTVSCIIQQKRVQSGCYLHNRAIIVSMKWQTPEEIEKNPHNSSLKGPYGIGLYDLDAVLNIPCTASIDITSNYKDKQCNREINIATNFRIQHNNEHIH